MSYPIRNDANSTSNVINIAGNMIKREASLRSQAPLTPGCLVTPYLGSANSSASLSGTTGEVEVASPGANLSVGVLDLSSANGMNLTDEYHQGDQVPVLYPTKGCIVNVRLETSASISANQPLVIAEGGFVTSGELIDAIGVAREDVTAGDSELPSFIKMEVL